MPALLTSLIVMLLFPWIHGKCRQSYSQNNLKLHGHVIKSLLKSESSQCISECGLHEKCHSINFDQDEGVCELNNVNHLSNPESLVYSHGSQYLNYVLRPVSKCSNKLCSGPLVCEIVDRGLDYKCVIEVLNFPSKSTENKVVLENAFDNLTSFTVAMWVQADPSTSEHTPFSFAINITHRDNYANEITIVLGKIKNKVSIGNTGFNVPSSTVDGKWHPICLTWENIQGEYNVYIDGVVKIKGTERVGRVITKGAIVLGQDQDDYLGKFERVQSFQGNLTNVNLWDHALTAKEISNLARSCTTGEGNIVKWSDLKGRGEGAVKLIHFSECGPN